MKPALPVSFRRPQSTLIPVDVTVRGGPLNGAVTTVWISLPSRTTTTGILTAFDVAPDGRRVLSLFDTKTRNPETMVHVLTNVDAEWRRVQGHGSKAQ